MEAYVKSNHQKLEMIELEEKTSLKFEKYSKTTTIGTFKLQCKILMKWVLYV